MRGLLIGIFYSTTGVWFGVVALILLLFAQVYHHHPLSGSTLSCGSTFYLVAIVLGLVGIMTYLLAVCCYKERQRGGQVMVNERAVLEDYFEQNVIRDD